MEVNIRALSRRIRLDRKGVRLYSNLWEKRKET